VAGIGHLLFVLKRAAVSAKEPEGDTMNNKLGDLGLKALAATL